MTLPPLPSATVTLRGVAVAVRPATLGFLARAAAAKDAPETLLALVAELVDIDPADLTEAEIGAVLDAATSAGRARPDFPRAPQ